MTVSNEDPALESSTAVLLHEYTYVSSLIPMYRGFQMQAVGLAMVIYTAVLGLLGSTIEKSQFSSVLEYALSLLPLPITLLVLSFAVMEIRVRRAALFIAQTLSPALNTILRRDAGDEEGLLTFELAPGRHLTAFERRMSSSLVFVLVVAAPALSGAVWLLGARPPASAAIRAITWVGIVLLFVASALASWLSATHEFRLLGDAVLRTVRRIRKPPTPTSTT